MGTTRDLVDAISSGDAVSIETAFNTAMAEKVSAKLDDMRQSVAQNMFKSPSQEQASPVEAE